MVFTEKGLAVEPEDYKHHYGYRRDFRTALPQILAVSVKNLLLLGYGMTLGFTTILIPAVREPREGEPLHLASSEISWISEFLSLSFIVYRMTRQKRGGWYVIPDDDIRTDGSINYIMVPLGCAVSGLVTTPLGRRRAMQMVNLPFLVAWLLLHFSTEIGHLYGALTLTGLAGGLLEAPVLTYVAEVTQPHLRGALSATSSMSIIIGVFTQFLFGLFLYWRTVALVNIIFTVLAVVALSFVPESPHWLVSRNRHDDARKSLQWLRGWTGPKMVEEELKDIQVLFKQKKEETAGETKETIREQLSRYMDRSFLVPYFLVSYAFFVGHFSGMTTLQTYAVSIFQMLEAPIDRYYATLILGLLQIFGCGTCVVLVHYTGKRALTFFSTGGAGICCLLVAVYDAFISNHSVGGQDTVQAVNETLRTSLTTTVHDAITRNEVNSYSWIPTVLMMLLALISHTGIRLLPWILIGEVFSAKTRSSAAGLSSAVGYIFGFLTNKMYISMVDMISIWGTYGLYSVICLSGSVVFYFILPETEGKKLNDIENHFAGIKRLTNEVYRSKKRSNKDVSTLQDMKGAVNPSFEGDESKCGA